jgi:DNA-binding MarR family transcriptional regulator
MVTDFSATDGPDFQFFNEINLINQKISRRMARALPSGLSYAQFSVLNHMARRGGKTNPAKLATTFRVTKGAMTNILHKLESQGWITVNADGSDGRKKVVFLSDSGQQQHDYCLARLQPSIDAMAEAFASTEFLMALPLLRSLHQWLDESR